MVPTAADIARYRHVAAGVIRALGWLVLVYVSAWLVRYGWDQYEGVVRQLRLAQASTGRGVSFQRYASGSLVHAVMLAAALLCVTRARWLARRLISAAPDPGCPRCGFALLGLTADRCPECGSYLGPEFLSQPVQSPASSPQEAPERT